VTCDRVMPLLSELVDATLPASTIGDVERHLELCDGCRAVLADLRAIRHTAATLDRLTPPASVWDRVAAEIASSSQRVSPAPPPARAVVESARLPRFALAAAAVLVFSTIVGLWMREGVRPVTRPANDQTAATTDAGAVPSVEEDVARTVERDYEQAIMGLEQVAQAESHALDPDIAAALNQNIAIVDRAIGDARQAVGTDPQDDELRAGLLDAFRSKLELLEQMVLLINEMRQGDQAGAAEIVGQLNP
jgi:anti-sigma factor RsiW